MGACHAEQLMKSGLAFVGALTLLSFSYSLLRGLYTVVRPSKPLRGTYRTESALITGSLSFSFRSSILSPLAPLVFSQKAFLCETGATDGIGLAIAKQLASNHGFTHLVLAGRSTEKLERTRRAITSECNAHVAIATITIDFERGDETQWASFGNALAQHDVGLVVHSAGASFPRAMYADEAHMPLHESLISVNCTSTARLLMATLPHMKKRKHGAIVTIGSLYSPENDFISQDTLYTVWNLKSIACYCLVGPGSGAGTVIPSDPLYSSYAASKAFVERLTRSVSAELANDKLGKGVHVQLQAPLFVVSKMSKIKKASALHPSPEAYARAAISHIGYEAVVTPWWTHKLLWWAVRCIPASRMDSIRFKQSAKLRQKALKKLGQQVDCERSTAGVHATTEGHSKEA
jgi:17beta-estradiol 17-dehydrogenase / very-long-chain 3-oxoacyl-CoA reductase